VSPAVLRSFAWAQAESVRKAEEERMKREAKEALLRANKERLDRLQAAWKEDQQLKEVQKTRSFCLYKQYTVDRCCLWLPSGHDLKESFTGSSSVCMPDSSSLFQVMHNPSQYTLAAQMVLHAGQHDSCGNSLQDDGLVAVWSFRSDGI